MKNEAKKYEKILTMEKTVPDSLINMQFEVEKR